MFCMRCGRELKDERHVFCPACREVMDACPIPPGVPINLPHRPEEAPQKKKHPRRRKELKPEEQIAKLRASNRWLATALIITVLAFAFTAIVLIHTLNEPEAPIGRNYSTVGQSDGT